MSDTTTVLTSRGIGVGATGLLVTVLGIGLASPILVWVGVAMVGTLAISAAWLVGSMRMFRRRFPDAWRTVTPLPLSVDGAGSVTVSVRTSRHRQRLGISNALASTLDIREQAAAELTGGLATKATVARSAQELRLDYQVNPGHRGRWPLGPALVKISEPLGMMWADVPAGQVENVPVWPRVSDLSAATGALLGHAERVILGARTPSADDASLRDYRDGDDLRRVHWKSTARRGVMVVRADERAGARPATVILDLPTNAVAAEWSISLAASIAVSVVEAGHPVRLIGANIPLTDVDDLSGHTHANSRTRVLNSTLDISVPVNRDEAVAHTRAAVAATSSQTALGEVIVAVLDPLPDDVITSLAPLGDSGRAWAIIRAGEGPRHDDRAAHTANSLARAGWKTVTASNRDTAASVWSQLFAGEPT